MELVADSGPGQILLADRAYDSDALRDSLAAGGAWANVKPKANRTRTLAFSAFLYKERNLVERFFNKLKHFRGVATRYDKLAENELAGVKLASARICIRHNVSVLRCSVPECEGLSLAGCAQREGLWDRFYTAAPRPRTPSEQRYSDRRLRSLSSPPDTA